MISHTTQNHANANANAKLISCKELHDLITSNQRSLSIIDCRFDLLNPAAGYQGYCEAHIGNAQYAHLDNDLAQQPRPEQGRHPLPDVAALADKLQQWGVDKNSLVVVYDQGPGAIAARLWWLLRWLGHPAQQIAILDGGFSHWQAQALPCNTGQPSADRGDFVSAPGGMPWVTTQRVFANSQQPKELLLDARETVRYTGEKEPIDPVAGHIPHAINHPFNLNLADGLFKSADILRAQFIEHLGAVEPSQVMHSCGSGVTACHNLFAMELAGLGGSQLYVGSWSEWIRDAARPIVSHC